MPAFLNFNLDVDANGWPPAAIDSVPVEVVGLTHRVLVSPFFVKGLSVNDVIECKFDEDGNVDQFFVLKKSSRSTIWLAEKVHCEWQDAKATLLKLGCSVETLMQWNICAIDLPEEISLDTFDRIMKPVLDAGAFIAYPSLRHPSR